MNLIFFLIWTASKNIINPYLFFIFALINSCLIHVGQEHLVISIKRTPLIAFYQWRPSCNKSLFSNDIPKSILASAAGDVWYVLNQRRSYPKGNLLALKQFDMPHHAQARHLFIAILGVNPLSAY